MKPRAKVFFNGTVYSVWVDVASSSGLVETYLEKDLAEAHAKHINDAVLWHPHVSQMCPGRNAEFSHLNCCMSAGHPGDCHPWRSNEGAQPKKPDRAAWLEFRYKKLSAAYDEERTKVNPRQDVLHDLALLLADADIELRRSGH